MYIKSKEFYQKNTIIEIFVNKQIKNNYIIEKKIIAGICLKGWEIKSIKENNFSLKNSFITIPKNKLIYLHNFIITPSRYSSKENITQKNRIKNILLQKKEILYLYNKSKLKGNTIIVLSLMKHNIWYKIQIGLAKGIKKYDKRNHMLQKQWNINKKNNWF